MTVEAFAPAKINLSLHLTGQRDDGFHLLDSLVVFADVGDRIVAKKSDFDSLTINGPYSKGISTDTDNLVSRAKALFKGTRPSALKLTKNLPVASGIGGGSSDAAATLRAIAELTGSEMPDRKAVLALGSDVPVCLMARPVRMRGVGEKLLPLGVPPLFFVLVNPGISLSTPRVFSALTNKANQPMPSVFPKWESTVDLCDWLTQQRNDLQAAAIGLEPGIQIVLDEIAATPKSLLSRMSGSGATCFGLYDNSKLAKTAGQAIQQKHPSWWVQSAGLWQLPN